MSNQNEAAFPQVSSLHEIKDTTGEFAALVQLEQQRTQGLTARQHAAIALRVPASGEPWLDAMIRRARLLDAAALTLQGFIAFGDHQKLSDAGEKVFEIDKMLAKSALEAATALLSEKPFVP